MFKRLSNRIDIFISQMPRPLRLAIICGEILLWAGYWASAIYRHCALTLGKNENLMDRTTSIALTIVIGASASGALILSTIKKFKNIKGRS
jgi:hypothetical protein